MFVQPSAPQMNAGGPGMMTSMAGSEMPTSTVEVSIRCADLIDRDIMSKSDPLCAVFQKIGNNKNAKWIEVGRTEVINDSLNPQWAKKFVLSYNFEVRQMLKFEVYDSDSSSNSLNQHDFLGRCEVSLGQVISSHSGSGQQHACCEVLYTGAVCRVVLAKEAHRISTTPIVKLVASLSRLMGDAGGKMTLDGADDTADAEDDAG